MSATETLSLARARRIHRRALRSAARGRPHQALTGATHAAQLLRRHAERDSARRPEYVASMLLVAELQLSTTSLVAAVGTLDELVATLESAPCPADTPAEANDRLADVLTRRGDTRRLLGEHRAAGRDLRRSADLACSPAQQAGAHNGLGILAKDTGRYDAAERHYERALTILEETLGTDHPGTASIHHNLAGLAHARGRYTEGEPHVRRALELRTRAAAPDPAQLASDLAVLGAIQAGEGRSPEAEATFRRTLQLWSRLRGPEHYEVAVCLHHLGVLQAARGDREAAVGDLRHALAITSSVLGPTHPETRQLAAHLDEAVHG